MSKIAKRDSWRTPLQHLPDKKAKVSINRIFSNEEYGQLKHGIIPSVMEDKWFVFMEDDTLFFHRSWSGVCIYEVHLNREHEISGAWVNRDISQYQEKDIDYDGKLLTFLIENLMLGNNLPFPVPNNYQDDLPKGVIQHSFSGTGYSEINYISKQSWVDKIKRLFNKKHKIS